MSETTLHKSLKVWYDIHLVKVPCDHDKRYVLNISLALILLDNQISLFWKKKMIGLNG